MTYCKLWNEALITLRWYLLQQSITSLHPKRVEDYNSPLIFEIVQPANIITCCLH